MELVDLMYRYINKFINHKKLLEELKQIDLSKYDIEEQEIIRNLIKEVKSIVDTIPNEIDEIEIKRKEQAQRMANTIKKALSQSNLDLYSKEKLNKQYNSLLKEKEITKDGGKLYKTLFKLMTQNELVSKYSSAMIDE